MTTTSRDEQRASNGQKSVAVISATYRGEKHSIYVDASDLAPVLSAGPWRISKNFNTYYARATQGQHGWITLHRFLLCPLPGLVVDHINHNGLDNRRCNLRAVTPGHNSLNRTPKAGVSGYRGVTKHNSKWRASVFCAGKRVLLGSFEEPKAASECVQSYLRQLGV